MVDTWKMKDIDLIPRPDSLKVWAITNNNITVKYEVSGNGENWHEKTPRVKEDNG